MSRRHADATPSLGNHVTQRWTFDNLAARDAFAYISADEGGMAQVGLVAPFSFHILLNSVGPSFGDVGVTGAGAVFQETVVATTLAFTDTVFADSDLSLTTVTAGTYLIFARYVAHKTSGALEEVQSRITVGGTPDVGSVGVTHTHGTTVGGTPTSVAIAALLALDVVRLQWLTSAGSIDATDRSIIMVRLGA